jgi:glycosyltransferase involved in cell wall biosynthesis
MSKSIDIIREWNNTQIEWVIVDDCSTDGSYEQLLMFRENSPQLNISIYRSEKNSGPGVARNIGVQKARGKYIAFLDSDDFFDKSFWNVVLPEMKRIETVSF